MSHFAVTLERIGEIREHTNADRLEMATLEGKDYEFVVGKGEFTAGDTVVYFPVDSVLPQWIIDALGLTGLLAGSNHNRVKTVRLRGNISQGLVTPPQKLADNAPAILEASTGDDVTDLLGVKKYDPPPVISGNVRLRPLPPFVSKYDIENAQNFVDIVQSLMDEPVYITEKIEGSHWGLTWLADDNQMIVMQRNYRIELDDDDTHPWHHVAHEGGCVGALRQMADALSANAITLRGEIVGPRIQGNYYSLKQHAVYLFEIELDGVPVAASEFIALTDKYDLPTVPVLAVDTPLREWLNGQSLKTASDGLSQIADMQREGIVIKPMTERRDDTLGRVFIKQRSPDYLATTDL